MREEVQGIGLHRYDPNKFPASFLDIADAQYNPLNPEEIIAGIHPSERPGKYGIAKFREGRLVARILLNYKWGSDLEIYIDAEEGLIYAATGTSKIEVIDLEKLKISKTIETGIKGVTSAALDSEGRLWVISNTVRGGDGWLYLIEERAHPKRIRKYSAPVSLDSMRISPWGRKLLVADYKRHLLECVSEEGELLGILYFPYITGVKWTLDERALISSGKYDKYTSLLLITGALHNTARSGWYGYIMDYGVQPSNRADAFYLNKVLIQWYLGFYEINLPLPKEVPFTVRVGEGSFSEGSYLVEPGFETFTPILVFKRCYVAAYPQNVKLMLERLVPYYSFIAPKLPVRWIEVGSFKGSCEIRFPGVYRIKTCARSRVEVYGVCK
ncbi:MAG: hypothetical protein DRJ41_03525 [Thermoprotei archaeon]|nr:MAG: hypothetical protein DRJ41_03525 [Thermoprotei archaeon]